METILTDLLLVYANQINQLQLKKYISTYLFPFKTKYFHKLGEPATLGEFSVSFRCNKNSALCYDWVYDTHITGS